MKLIIHITRYIKDVAEGETLVKDIMEQFAHDPLIHVNAIADHNYKHPEPPDPVQLHNPDLTPNES